MPHLRIKSSNTLPLHFEPRRSQARRRPPSAVRRAAAVRNRGHLASADVSGEQLGTWLIQGGVVVAMLGILVFFRVPLMSTLNSWAGIF